MLSVESFPLAPGCEAIHAHWRLTRRPGAGGVGDPPRQGVLLMVARGAGDDWKIALVQNTNLALVPPSA